MEALRISAKNLGEIAMEDSFCPRCFWIKLKTKLPFQIFPGIFSSIDAYTKKVTNLHYDRHGSIPEWFNEFGDLGRPVKVPHFSKFNTFDEETQVLLTGVPDEIFKGPDGSYFIADYKTAKYTGAQDELLPMYDIQLNGYAYIAERTGFSPVSGLGLIYYEPQTDISEPEIDSYVMDGGFAMHFSPKLKPMELRTDVIPPLLKKAKEIFDMSRPPASATGCKNCDLLDQMMGML
jgi:hypothetical protein